MLQNYYVDFYRAMTYNTPQYKQFDISEDNFAILLFIAGILMKRSKIFNYGLFS
jgi:hypothetical protein